MKIPTFNNYIGVIEVILEINEKLKQEADTFLYDMGLKKMLSCFGDVQITGSYALDLMVWRDLDIFVDISKVSQRDIYQFANEIFEQFKPIWFETKNTFEEETGCPKGYFVGFETLLNNQLWNFDIWFTNIAHIEENENYINDIRDLMTEPAREIIIDIKAKVHKHPQYGTEFFSIDVYQSVINEEIKTLNEFKEWLKKKRNIDYSELVGD
ncbi:hypothetical protein [Haloplasma contractile]|uniref:Uncharacterized protein n=1 Tax=Haloplasma contractile SSD-17B TaxID=1033810 RepID=U2FGZ7_9MOLU|nr:hypothetical protein [Haloplasma contractile]ERJ12130.1 hypothetical protein HLPCO_001657 [Haloplasma contractile SSD-17B]